MAGPGPAPGPEVLWRVRHVEDRPLQEEDWADFEDAAQEGFDGWQSGLNVMVRCSAGFDRSGLVACLMMISAGMEPVRAVERMRSIRSPYVLCNPDYLEAVLSRGGTSQR